MGKVRESGVLAYGMRDRKSKQGPWREHSAKPILSFRDESEAGGIGGFCNCISGMRSLCFAPGAVTYWVHRRRDMCPKNLGPTPKEYQDGRADVEVGGAQTMLRCCPIRGCLSVPER